MFRDLSPSALPAASEPRRTLPSDCHIDTAARAVTQSAERSVLVVDDEELVGSMLDVMLKRFGCAVWVAQTGTEGIDRLRADESIVLILLDVRMPGLDGPETLQIMRTLRPDVHCCFMTGDIGKYTEDDLLSHGVVSILKKPFRLTEIAQVLEKAGIAPGLAKDDPQHC